MSTLTVVSQFRIDSTKKGLPLVPPSNLTITIPVTDAMVDAAPEAFFSLVESDLRQKAVEVFIKQLKADPTLKRRIGGTQWSVVPCGDVESFPMFTNPDDVGKINPGRNLNEVIHRNHAIRNIIHHQPTT